MKKDSGSGNQAKSNIALSNAIVTNLSTSAGLFRAISDLDKGNAPDR
jgi:hypothetical protein